MEGMLQPPSASAFDAAASIVSLLVYLGVAVAAVWKTPADTRARAFLAVAVASGIPYALAPLQWWKGPGLYTPGVIALAATAFAVGGLALFHFTQVFPAQRPWIAAHGRWITAAYAALPLPVAALSWGVGAVLMPMAASAGGDTGAVSLATGLLLIGLTIPLILLVGVLLPCAGVLSLVKSWQEAKANGRERERSATFWMLVSQLGGGVLAVLVLPMLHLIGIGPPWSMLIAVLTYAFALLLPASFFRYAAAR
ncbi:MAG TPA: hypothetical protein VGI12_08380 [Vicinamibacterales bacterium]|jgi:hypothetical protein